jgi:tRNA-modifying protein YgfZ
MRMIFELTGTDRLTFLQGMVSNDMRPLGSGDGIKWTALLTPQGKYLADFFVVAMGGRLLLDIHASMGAGTVKRLLMYRLRADVQITPCDLIVTCGVGDAPATALPDPRHTAMGWRHYGAPIETAAVDWDAIRVTHVIPESGVELIPNDTYLLEAGFERLHGVDFRKGCYVGQEVTARMKHKTELKKGLARVAIQGEAPIGTPILAGEKVAGTLFTQSHGFAIAYLRFDWAMGQMSAGDARLTLID